MFVHRQRPPKQTHVHERVWRRVGGSETAPGEYAPGAGAAAAPPEAAGLRAGRGGRPAAARQRRQAAHLQPTRTAHHTRHTRHAALYAQRHTRTGRRSPFMDAQRHNIY